MNNIALVRSESKHLKSGQVENGNRNNKDYETKYKIDRNLEDQKKYYENIIDGYVFREYDNILEESEEHTSEELTPELRGFNRWLV